MNYIFHFPGKNLRVFCAFFLGPGECKNVTLFPTKMGESWATQRNVDGDEVGHSWSNHLVEAKVG